MTLPPAPGKPPGVPPPRFVELVRVSSQGQAAADTPADQRAALDRLRASRPGSLVERIEHTGSGAAAGSDRPDLQRLAQLAEARAFDEVRVRHLDRLTRHEDPLERAYILATVRRAGAVIVDAGGTVLDPATMGGELHWVVATLGSAEERRKIAERTMAGKARARQEGRLASGRPPYGLAWDKHAKVWALYEPEAAVVRRMFAMVLGGTPLRQIAATLNAEGIPGPNGGQWHPAPVHRVLSHPAARGVYRTRGQEIPVPPVVDVATWETVQVKMAANRHKSGPPNSVPALLRKIAACGDCGHSLRVDGRNTHRAYTYYFCPACWIYHRTDVVDEAVRGALREFVNRPDNVEAAATRQAPEEDPAGLQDAVTAAERAVTRAKRQQENVGRLAAAEEIPADTAKTLLAEAKQRRTNAEAELQAARRAVEAAEHRKAHAAEERQRIEEIRQRIATATEEDWRDLCQIVFPPGGVRLYTDGRMRLTGLIPLGSALRGPSCSSRATGQITEGIPVALRLVSKR